MKIRIVVTIAILALSCSKTGPAFIPATTPTQPKDSTLKVNQSLMPSDSLTTPIQVRLVSSQTGTFGLVRFYLGSQRLNTSHQIDTSWTDQMNFGQFKSDSSIVVIAGCAPGYPIHADLIVRMDGFDYPEKYIDFTDTTQNGSDHWLNINNDFKNF